MVGIGVSSLISDSSIAMSAFQISGVLFLGYLAIVEWNFKF
ncbi:hypothetical protein [Marinomonas spartinae]